MNKALRFSPLLVVVLFVLLTAGRPTYGQPAALFQDDFNDGDDVGWSVVEGTWTVVGGVYVAPDPGGWNLVAKSIAGEDWWGDYTFEGRFMLVAGRYEATLLFRVQWALPGVNHAEFYQIAIGLEAATLAETYGVQGGANITILESAPYSIEADTWYRFKIVLDGPNMEYYVDDQLVMSSDGLNSYSTGKIGLKTGHYGEAYFDDISVYSPNTPVGSDVSLLLEGGLGSPGGVELSFPTVTGGGTTTVTKSTGGPPPPTGLKIVGSAGQPVYYDINTTATFSGLATVCIAYDETEVKGPEANLKLRHHDGTRWVDIMSSLDTTNDIICGETLTLSPFAVMQPVQAAVGGTVYLLRGPGDGGSLTQYILLGAVAAIAAIAAAGALATRHRSYTG